MTNTKVSSPAHSSFQAVTPEEKKHNLWPWLISLLLPLCILLLPETAGLTVTVKRFLAITVWAVTAMATDVLPSALVAMLLPVFYIVANVAKPQAAFAPWTTSVVWITVGGMLIASVLMTSGIAKRIAYLTIIRSGGTFTGALIGLTITGIIINPFVPSIMGKLAIIVPIAMGICQVFKMEPQSRGASAVMMAAFLGVATTRIGFFTGDGGIPMMINIVSKITAVSVSWTQYAYHNLFIAFMVTVLGLVIVIFALKPETEVEAKEVIWQKYKEMGPMTLPEKKVALLLTVTIIALLTDSIHKIDPGWIFVILGGVCFLPGVNLMDDAQLGKLNYKMIFFVAGCMSIGIVATASGAGKWLGTILFPYLAGSALYTTIAAWFFGVALNFLLTPLAAMASFTAPIAEVCIKSGLNPLPTVYSFLFGLDQYILPYEFAGLLFVYSYGYISLKALIKVVAIRMAVSGVAMIVIAYPYWKFIGLLK
jgi:di/tricarboxylate transporter